MMKDFTFACLIIAGAFALMTAALLIYSIWLACRIEELKHQLRRSPTIPRDGQGRRIQERL
jgi:hypothetical protein